jgi:hypothetical protein
MYVTLADKLVVLSSLRKSEHHRDRATKKNAYYVVFLDILDPRPNGLFDLSGASLQTKNLRLPTIDCTLRRYSKTVSGRDRFARSLDVLRSPSGLALCKQYMHARRYQKGALDPSAALSATSVHHRQSGMLLTSLPALQPAMARQSSEMVPSTTRDDTRRMRLSNNPLAYNVPVNSAFGVCDRLFRVLSSEALRSSSSAEVGDA